MSKELSGILCYNCLGGDINSQLNSFVIVMGLLFSGSLLNVRQIGIEFHEVPENIRRYFTIVQKLYKLGFVTIAWDPNLTTKPVKGPFRYFEIVFRRSNVDECQSP